MTDSHTSDISNATPSAMQTTLAAVLNDIAANKSNLSNQLETAKQQVGVLEAQIVKFDALLAVLQLSSTDTTVLSLAHSQHVVNSTVSPTGPAAANEAAVAGAAA
jgi:hypothetical protein